jgi:hypothetical protein
MASNAAFTSLISNKFGAAFLFLFCFRLPIRLLYCFYFLFPVRFNIAFPFMAQSAVFGVYIRLRVFMRLSEIDCVFNPTPNSLKTVVGGCFQRV